MGLNCWDYETHHTHINPDQPMEVLIQALFDTKEAEGDRVYYIAFGRYKDVHADAISWLYLYAYTKFHVYGSHDVRLPDGNVTTVPGEPFPNTSNKAFWDELVRQRLFYIVTITYYKFHIVFKMQIVHKQGSPTSKMDSKTHYTCVKKAQVGMSHNFAIRIHS